MFEQEERRNVSFDESPCLSSLLLEKCVLNLGSVWNSVGLASPVFAFLLGL
jgi:hypothetical protein